MSRWNWEWDFLALSKTSDELPLPTFLPVTRQKKNSLTRVALKSPLQPSHFMILWSQTNVKWGRRKNHNYGRLPSQYGWWLVHSLCQILQALLLFILIATLEGQCYDWTDFPDKASSEGNTSEPKQDDSRVSTAPAALHACSTDPPKTRKPSQEANELKTIFTIIQNVLCLLHHHFWSIQYTVWVPIWPAMKSSCGQPRECVWGCPCVLKLFFRFDC